MHVFFAGCNNPMVEDAVFELALGRLELLPGDRDESRIDVIMGEARQDDIGLRRSTSRGIAEFTAKDEEGFAVDNELGGAGWGRYDVRKFVCMGFMPTRCRRDDQAQEVKRVPQAQQSPFS
ncbi:MAG: hypothetical protein NVSMB62_02770 [Acidobacteriaceae bacterium]